MVGQWEMTKMESQRKSSNTPWQHQTRVRMRQSLSAFMRAYCRWIGSGFTAALVLMAMVFYWLLSSMCGFPLRLWRIPFLVKLALRVVPNITPRKLLLADSPLNEVSGILSNGILLFRW